MMTHRTSSLARLKHLNLHLNLRRRDGSTNKLVGLQQCSNAAVGYGIRDAEKRGHGHNKEFLYPNEVISLARMLLSWDFIMEAISKTDEIGKLSTMHLFPCDNIGFIYHHRGKCIERD
jgi:hypothetical protein